MKAMIIKIRQISLKNWYKNCAVLSCSVVSETLYDPMDCSLPGSTVHGTLQARILEWVVIFFSREFPNPGIETRSPPLQTDFL